MAKKPYTLDNAGNDEPPETPKAFQASADKPVVESQTPPATPDAKTQTATDKPSVNITSAQTLPVVIDNDGEDDLKDYVEPKVPVTLKESYALFGKVNAMPESTRKEKRVKEKMLAFAKLHCHRLQQGLPDVSIAATMSHFTQQVASLKRERLAMLARTNPDVQELLDENATLCARCKALEEKLKP